MVLPCLLWQPYVLVQASHEEHLQYSVTLVLQKVSLLHRLEAQVVLSLPSVKKYEQATASSLAIALKLRP